MDTFDDFEGQLKALGYRAREISWEAYINKIAICVNRLRVGEKPWQLFGAAAKDRMVSQDLGQKIARDYGAGKLDFLENFRVSDAELARRDPFRITRYEIVAEAEALAPHNLWNLHHLKKTLGFPHEKAMAFLKAYDSIRRVRSEAEVTIDSYDFRVGELTNTRPVTLRAATPVMAMRQFRQLPQYLKLLYEMHYRTEYPDAPTRWVARACSIRAEGKLNNNEGDDVAAADNIFRYAIWESPENESSYYENVPAPGNTKASHERVVRNLHKRFGLVLEGE